MHDHVPIRLSPDRTPFTIGRPAAVHVVVANWRRRNICNSDADFGFLAVSLTNSRRRTNGKCSAAYKKQRMWHIIAITYTLIFAFFNIARQVTLAVFCYVPAVHKIKILPAKWRHHLRHCFFSVSRVSMQIIMTVIRVFFHLSNINDDIRTKDNK